MEMDEEVMSYLEENIPEMAQAAVTEAYWKAPASGFNLRSRKQPIN